MSSQNDSRGRRPPNATWRTPTARNLKRIADALNMPVGFFLRRREEDAAATDPSRRTPPGRTTAH